MQLRGHAELPNTPIRIDWDTRELIRREALESLGLRKLGVYSPSSIRGCKRALYYSRIGVEPELNWDDEMLALFRLGHIIHDMRQRDFAILYPGFVPETPVCIEELGIAGHSDGVFVNEVWNLEIKTVGDSTFKSTTSPKKDHKFQATCYMKALGIPRTLFVYINRNNGQEEVYPYSFQPEIWDEIVEIVTGVESKVRAGVPPEKEVSAWKCKRCPYLHACQPFGEKGKSTWRRV